MPGAGIAVDVEGTFEVARDFVRTLKGNGRRRLAGLGGRSIGDGDFGIDGVDGPGQWFPVALVAGAVGGAQGEVVGAVVEIVVGDAAGARFGGVVFGEITFEIAVVLRALKVDGDRRGIGEFAGAA